MKGLLTPVSTNLRAQARGDLVVPGGLKIVTDSFRCQAAKLWNAAPLELRQAKSLYTAKRIIKDFVKTLPT